MMHYAFIFYHCSHFAISMESYEETAVMIKQQSELSSNDRVYVTPPERQLLKHTCGWGCRVFWHLKHCVYLLTGFLYNPRQ